MQIGRYEVLRKLGEGGTAKVLLGRSLATDQEVVLKVPLQTSPDMLERLRDEARVGLRLQHPGIVETLDLFEHEGKPILVVEYVDGASLQQIRKVGPLAPAAVVRIGRQVAEALEAIHAVADEKGQPLNMLHRDVTPANLLVTRAGDAKLIDLGIARSAETQARATQSGAVRGTLRYLAPELIEGKKHSAATDLWALGVVLWEAVLGRRAVVGDDREILTAILRGDVMRYQPGEALDPRLHDALAALIAAEASRIQRAKAAGNILARLESAFGDGQPPAQAAVDMAMRLSPDDDTLDIGDHTKQVLAQAPEPITMPPSAPADPDAGRKVAGLDDSLEEEGAATVQMQAVDIPPASNPLAATQSGPAVPAVASPAPAAVAPVSQADLNDSITGRYARTEQAMPAVSGPLAGPSDLGLPHTDPDSTNKTVSDESTASPPLSASTEVATGTNVRGLGVNEETEHAYDNPYDEAVAPAPPGSANLKSTQLLHGGSGLPSLEAATIKAMPAVDTTALDPALAATQAAQRPPPPGPALGPTGTAVNMPAPDLGLPTQLAGPPIASAVSAPPAASPSPAATPPRTAPPATAPPQTAPPQTAPPQTAPPLTAAPQTALPATAPPATAPPQTAPPQTAPPAAAPPKPAPPTTAPPKAAPPATAPPATAPPATAPPAAAAPVGVTSPQGTPNKALAAPPVSSKPAVFNEATAGAPYNAPGGQVPDTARPTEQQPAADITAPEGQPVSSEPPAPAAASTPAAASLAGAPAGEPAGQQGPFGQTVTQAFFTSDIKSAMAAEAAANVGPATIEMEAAIAPVEQKIAGLVAGIALVVGLLVGGIYWLVSGNDDEGAGSNANATADAGVRVDAGTGAGKVTAPPVEEKKKAKSRKKRKRKRKRKR